MIFGEHALRPLEGLQRAGVDGNGNFVLQPLEMLLNDFSIRPVRDIGALKTALPDDLFQKRRFGFEHVQILFGEILDERFPRPIRDIAPQQGLQVFLVQQAVVFEQDAGRQVVPDFVGDDFMHRVRLEILLRLRVHLFQKINPFMFLKIQVGAHAV